MKKKIVTALLLLALSTSVVACGDKKSRNSNMSQPTENSNNTQEKNKESEQKKEEKSKETKETNRKNSQTIDGITLSANTFSIEPYEDSDGEYTKRISVNFTVKNDSDKAFGYLTSWDGKLSDGYKLQSWSDISSMDLKQVASGSEKTDTAYFLIDDSVDPNEIIVTYNFQDYGEEYWKDLGKIMAGEMEQDEYMDKWGEYETIEFTISRK